MKYLALAALTLGFSLARAESIAVQTLDDSAALIEMTEGASLAAPSVLDGIDGSWQIDRISHRALSCFARDGFRVTYRATTTGYWASARQVQRAAVRYCRNHSYIPWTCKPLGCRWVF